ncbi:hypothetical protein [Agrococcus lahaulensis]|uniref:hypothetical protein n=1 Tax=Agrococcus lahaulensis TaxID=341722 RepID=UPI0012EC35D3|nr:hypothetical protein [Agrococcus lahaulensis]
MPKAIPLEEVQKRARLLVVDDNDFVYMDLFRRDGYHIERWPSITDLSQLTDGRYTVILLDIHGVAVESDAALQGLGILQAVKNTKPGQAVILYSSRKHQLSHTGLVQLADRALDKRQSYIDFKLAVDELLKRQADPAFYMAQILAGLDPAGQAPDRLRREVEWALARKDPSRLRDAARGVGADAAKIELAVSLLDLYVSSWDAFS